MADFAVEAAALIFEARLLVEATTLGLARVIARESSPKIAAELATLRKMSNQAGDALEVLQKTIVCAPPEGNA